MRDVVSSADRLDRHLRGQKSAHDNTGATAVFQRFKLCKAPEVTARQTLLANSGSLAGVSDRAASQDGASTSGRAAGAGTGLSLPPALGAAPHLGTGSARKLSKGQILSGYKAQLHEYRVLKDELAPWTQAFAAKHGRKPRISDVERTGKSRCLPALPACITPVFVYTTSCGCVIACQALLAVHRRCAAVCHIRNCSCT